MINYSNLSEKSEVLAFIDGAPTAAASKSSFETINPSNGIAICRITECGTIEVDQAVNAARRSFDSGIWSHASPADRKAVLLRFAQAIDDNRETLALLESQEAGKPISDCLTIDIPDTANTIRWHAEATDKIYGEVAPTPSSVIATIVREPIGVVGAILPWNFPALMAAWKIGPALSAGNSMIIKPAEQTSISTVRLAELAYEAGVPAGVLNVVTGPGETVGKAIGLHSDIDMVAFTGSTEIGRMFLDYSARSNLKRISLECGGKNPQIVFESACDLELVSDHAINAAFWNMGQNCSAGSRMLVHRSLIRELTDRIVAKASSLPVGAANDLSTRIGPLIEADHLKKVLEYINTGLEEGAVLATGGSPTMIDSGGYFVPPTIFTDVSPKMRIAKEEIFGPVVCLIPFDTEQEAVTLANDTCYGLSASIWTEDLRQAHRVSRMIKAGTVTVNCFGEGDAGTPFGGYRQSGFVGRDKSLHAHHQYCELKTIWIDVSL